jgi:hypothetical protein
VRFQILSCEQSFDANGNPDGYSGQGGWIDAYKITATALEDFPSQRIAANTVQHLKGNFKKPPSVGETVDFDFKLKKDGSGRAVCFSDGYKDDGTQLWRMLVERTKQGGGGYQQNRPQNAPQRPQSAPNPQQAPKAVPTMSQALSVLKECVEAVKTFGGSDAHATTLFLARLRGDIRKDPSPQELEAAAAAEAAKAQAAKEAAERAAAEAARQAALAAMPPAETLPEGDIPF